MNKKNLVLTTLAAVALGLTACGGGTSSSKGGKSSGTHKHTWGAWTETKAATCTEKGTEQRECSECHEKDTRETNKKDHEYEAFSDATHQTVVATCGQEGVSYEKCKNCGDIKENKTGKADHAYGDAVPQVNAEAATASTLATCGTCGEMRVQWKAEDLDQNLTAQSSSLKPSVSKGAVKFSSTPFNYPAPTGGADAGTEGSYIGYSVYVPGAAKKAVLSWDVTGHSQGATIFATMPNDEKPGSVFKDGAWVTADNRVALVVNGVEVPLGTDPYGEQEASYRGWFDFPAEVKLNKGVNNIVLQCYGGYRLNMHNFALKFVDESHKIDEHIWNPETAPTQGATDVALTRAKCDCGDVKLEIDAMDANKVVKGTLKDSKAGFMKLKSNGDSVTYTFTLDKGFEGVAYQRGFQDNYASNKAKGGYYEGSSGPINNPNFDFSVNGKVVDVSAMKGVSFTDMFGPDADADDNSAIKYIEIGKVELVAGENTIVYKRNNSFNLAVDRIAFIGADSCSHNWVADAANPDVAPQCGVAGENHFKCDKCGAKKSEPVAALEHDMQPVAEADLDAAHQLSAGNCTTEAVTGWKKCTRCDHWEAVKGAKADHEFVNDTCKNCGAIKVEYGASTPLWNPSDSYKQAKKTNQDFNINVAEAGNYSVSMYVKAGSGSESQKLSARAMSFKINDGDSLAATNDEKTTTQLGLTPGTFAWAEITVLALPQGAVKLNLAFGEANYRFTADTNVFYMVLAKVAA